MTKYPSFDRKSLTFSARRLERGIHIHARFNAPKLSSGEQGRYRQDITVDPETRAVIGLSTSYSRDGSRYLAAHGSGHDRLRLFATQIRDRFLKSPCWAALKGRDPDPHYIVDQEGNVTVRQRSRD